MTLTPELLADLRAKAEAAQGDPDSVMARLNLVAAASPSVVLALLDALETERVHNASIRRRLDSAEEDVDARRAELEALRALVPSAEELDAARAALALYRFGGSRVETQAALTMWLTRVEAAKGGV